MCSLTISPLLPQRRSSTRSVTHTQDRTLVHIIKYLVELALQEISQPLNIIPPTPILSSSLETTKGFERHSESKSKLENSTTSYVFLDMANNLKKNQP